jgi:hypothetical protein
MKQQEIAVGMPATLCVGSDSYAYEITELIPYANGYKSKKWGIGIKYAVIKRNNQTHRAKIKYNDKYGYHGELGGHYVAIGIGEDYLDPPF